MWDFKFNKYEKEKRTVEVMIKMYCKAHHKSKGLCDSCTDLLSYSLDKYYKCPFGDEKPVCFECHIHCYQPLQREKIKQVMRFAGPGMIFSHPIMAIEYFISKKYYFRQELKNML